MAVAYLFLVRSMRIHFITRQLIIFAAFGLMLANASWNRPGLGVLSRSALAAGVVLVATACYTHFGLRLRSSPRGGPFGLSWIAIIGLSMGLLGILAALVAGLFVH